MTSPHPSASASSPSSISSSSSGIAFVLRLVVLTVLLVAQRTRQFDVTAATPVANGNGPLPTPTESSPRFFVSALVSKTTDQRTSAGVNKQAPGGATTGDVARYFMDDPPTSRNLSAAAEEVQESSTTTTNGTTPASWSTSEESATGGSTTSTTSTTSSHSSDVAALQDGIVDWIRFYSRTSGSNGSESANETRTYYSSTLVDDEDDGDEIQPHVGPPPPSEDDRSQASPEESPSPDDEEAGIDGLEDLRPSGKPCRRTRIGDGGGRGVAAGEKEASAAPDATEEAEDNYSLHDNADPPEVGEGTESLVSSRTGKGGEAEEMEEGEGAEEEEEEKGNGERELRDCIRTENVQRRNGSTTVRGVAGVKGARDLPSPLLSPPPPPQPTTNTIDQAPIPAGNGETGQEPFDSEPVVVLHSGKDSEDMDWLENGDNGFVRTFCWLSLATIVMFTVIGSIKYRQEIVGGLKQIRLSYATRDRRQKPTVEEANTLLSHAQV